MRARLVILILIFTHIAAAPAAAQSDGRDTIRSIGARKRSPAHRTHSAQSTRSTTIRRGSAAIRPKPAPKRETAKPATRAASGAVTRPVLNPRPVPQVWDLGRDFSTAANPHGPWSFGFAIELNAPLELFREVSRIPTWYRTDQLAGWCLNDEDIAPYVMKNVSSAAWSFDGTGTGGGAAIIEPGKVALHPRLPDRYAVVEWKAPRKGVFLITASFSRVEQVQGQNSNYFVLKNRAILEGATGILTGYGQSNSTATYRSPQLALEAGDTLRFAVGFGTDGNSNADANILDVNVRSVEHSSMP